MTRTETVKQYGETAVSAYKTLNLAVIGAGDLAVERARTAVAQFRSKATSSIVALPGEAHVQADLAVKEARTRATEAAGTARTAAQQFTTVVRPDVLRDTVTGLVETARTQAISTVEHLAAHGAEVVEELRRQPGFRRIVRQAEHAVDAVEDTLEDVLEETAEAVVEASNEVTSVAQKTAAKATKVAAKAEEKVEDAAEATKAVAEDAVEEPKPATKANAAKKTAPAARKSPAKATSARVTRARTAKPADPTAVPAKKN
jgi:heparin binding hemagglutinin HbhA